MRALLPTTPFASPDILANLRDALDANAAPPPRTATDVDGHPASPRGSLRGSISSFGSGTSVNHADVPGQEAFLAGLVPSINKAISDHFFLVIVYLMSVDR
jgi:hypothetical protein